MKHQHDEIAGIRERQLWADYATPRFTLGTDRERSMHQLFKARVHSAFDRLLHDAQRHTRALDFSHVRLQCQVIQALEGPCCYCGELFGVDDFGVVYDTPPGGRNGNPAPRALANLAAPCSSCARAKGPLSGNEWRDVLAALRAADAVAARAVLDALARGYAVVPRPGRREGTPPGAPAASNARGGVSR